MTSALSSVSLQPSNEQNAPFPPLPRSVLVTTSKNREGLGTKPRAFTITSAVVRIESFDYDHLIKILFLHTFVV